MGKQALHLERPQGSPQGDTIDPQHLAQLTFGGQAVSRGQLAGFDAIEQALGNLQVEGSGSDQATERTLGGRHRAGFLGVGADGWRVNGLLVYANPLGGYHRTMPGAGAV